ncbi:hypothetical protein V2J09_021775 [Rumex salicifolius]
MENETLSHIDTESQSRSPLYITNNVNRSGQNANAELIKRSSPPWRKRVDRGKSLRLSYSR